ncbi:MAG: STAS domain-containing protein [Oscillospiraceae bacterium]|nr:STAS domain-containing protein [Oscillospiraceae bacterium]
MELGTAISGRVLTLSLRGELDHHGAQGLIRRVEREIESSLPLELVLDMGGVSFMDSSGIALVIRSRRRMEELHGTLQLANVPPQPRKVLEASGVARLMNIQ